MVRITSLIIISACITISFPAFAQSENMETPHPKFSPFKGMVYDMPKMEVKRGKLVSIGIQEFYTDTVYTYPQLGEITLDKLDIPETYTKEGSFPGVDKKIKFAMILDGKMEILVDGCYEFTLQSDDGSRLWIDEQQLISNDGGHKMKTKKDSTAFTKGMYDAKVWYFQGMPDRFGLKMDAKLIGKIETCPNKIESKKGVPNVITLSKFHFETDKYEIDKAAMDELKAAVTKIKESGASQIEIIGHTDNQGTEAYNKNLSIKRAEAVKQKLEELIMDEKIDYIVSGMGSTKPIASNNDEKGKRSNRRVELIFR